MKIETDLQDPTQQATKLPPDAISTEPLGTHLPHGLSQVFLSLLEKDKMLARNFHTSYKVTVWARPGQRQWLRPLESTGIVDRVSMFQQAC